MGLRDRFMDKMQEQSNAYASEFNANMRSLLVHMIQIEKNQCELSNKIDKMIQDGKNKKGNWKE